MQRVQAQYNEKESQKLYEDMLSDARCPVRLRLPGPTWHKLCTHELLYWGHIGVILGLYRNYIGVTWGLFEQQKAVILKSWMPWGIRSLESLRVSDSETKTFFYCKWDILAY